jgi:hypothetical protein
MVLLPSAIGVGTKENHKGSTRSYYHSERKSRTIVVGLVLWLVATVAYIVRIRIHGRTGPEPQEFLGRWNDVPLHPIDRGVDDTPLVMIRSQLPDDLLQRFLLEHLYSCDEDGLNAVPELDNRVKPPVYVYEGYYHSLPTSGTVYSKNPNPLIGRDFDKPAAAPFTRAFFQAVRTVNRDVFDTLSERLLEASSSSCPSNHNGTQPDVEVSCLLARWIRTGRHFGDLSVQIHYGKGNQDKLASGRAWHTDAANSLLHLAVTLRGHRTLHSKRRRGEVSSDTTTDSFGLRREPHQRRNPEEVLEDQRPGSVYLSSSTLMTHAPEFFDTSHESRSIAIHARLLYTSREVNRFYEVRTPESWAAMTKVLAEALSHARLRVPTLAQVESTLVEQIHSGENE